MIKVIILICRLAAPCTEDSSVAAIMADRSDDGTPCPVLGLQLLNQVRADLAASGTKAKVTCTKDGQPFR